jgi:hypothetical protein
VVSQEEATGGWSRGGARWQEEGLCGGDGCSRLEQRQRPAVGMAAPGWRWRPAAGQIGGDCSVQGVDARWLGQLDDDRSGQGGGSGGLAPAASMGGAGPSGFEGDLGECVAEFFLFSG